MTTEIDTRRFLRLAVISSAIAALLEVVFVVVVDPYGIYRIWVGPGFNAVKPALTRYQNEIKLSHALALAPDVILTGNSRAEIGFDPDAPAFRNRGATAYNLAIPGVGIDTPAAQIRELIRADTPPKTIVLGVEFLDFLQTGTSRPAETPPPDLPSAVKMWGWRFDALFSLTSLKDAIQTLRIQRDGYAAVITPKGFNPLNEYRKIARESGYYTLFRQKAQEYAGNYVKTVKKKFVLGDMQPLRAILDTAGKSSIEVKLIIYPYHAQLLSLFEEAGLWPAFEEWKVRVLDEVLAARRRYPSLAVALFDFSGYDSYSCERVPPQGDFSATTRWYWEAGHFKKELGDIVLEQVMTPAKNTLPTSDAANRPAEGFGMKLEATAQRENQQRIALQRAQCARAYPELFEETRSLVASARR